MLRAAVLPLPALGSQLLILQGTIFTNKYFSHSGTAVGGHSWVGIGLLDLIHSPDLENHRKILMVLLDPAEAPE